MFQFSCYEIKKGLDTMQEKRDKVFSIRLTQREI